MADEKGVRHVNEDKNMADDKLAELAISLATGGVSDYNDRKVIRPYGMKADDFESAIETQLEIVAKNTGFDLGDIEDLPLFAVPGQDGAYYLLSGNKILPDKQGKPVIVRVK
jgi:hypothetical protein